MGASGSKSVAVTSYDTLKFSWWENSQSIEGNYTVVGWKMELVAVANGYISSSASKSWSVTVNGTSYSGSNTVGISNNSTKTLASGTTTISHGSDGTKSFNYSFSQQFAINFNGYVGTISGSSSGTLTTIPRKSTLTVSNGTLGTAQTVTVNRKSTSFTHTVTYACGSYSGTLCTKSTSTSLSWTPDLDFANGAPNGESVYVSFKIETYNGDTLIGSDSASIYCAIPASLKPTVSFTTTDSTGYLSTYSGYVQGKSKFKISITASGAYSSTIKSYSTTVDNKTYTGSSVTTDEVKSSGSLTITVTVTDSRGRTATATAKVTVLAYEVPKISSLTVKRCTSDGTTSSSGAYLSVVFTASATSLNSKNTVTYKVQYKKKDASSYTTQTLTAYANKYSVENGSYVFAADTSSSYDIILSVADAFSTATKTAEGATTSKLFSFLHRGLGFAFGKVAELEGYLEVKFKGRFYDDVQVDKSLTVTSKSNLNGGASVSGGLAVNGGEHVNGGLTYEIPVKNNDANTTLTSGNYYMGSSATNKAEGLNGWLEVQDYDSGNYCYQKYSTYTGNVYERWRNDGTWGDWIANVNKSNMASLMDQNILWSGGAYMNASQTITLSEAVSAQRNGIVLLWCWYNNGVQYNNMAPQFIPKKSVADHGGCAYIITMATEGFGYIGTKKVYVSDSKITGLASNGNGSQSGSIGVTYYNACWALARVYGF